MPPFPLKYRTFGKGLPPRPIRLEIPGWAGDTSKMEDGSVPQPWHCNPFVEASTYGLELIYPYDTECHVINESGQVRIEWDFAGEADAGITGGEFVQFAPNHYGFNTSLDVQAPPGHVLRLEPHPRYFTDRSGAVPCPIIGHLQTEWWPKLFFVAFKAPLAGQRHVFRKGEAYAQLIVVPGRVSYNVEAMTAQEADDRLALESSLAGAKDYIAEHAWHDHRGQTFNNQYKVLTRVFHTAGAEGVRSAIREGMRDMVALLPVDATPEQALATAREFHQTGRYAEARAICYQILEREPNHGEALHFLAESAMHANRPMLAVECLQQAVAAHPNSVRYWSDLGTAWLAAGRAQDALEAISRAAQLEPGRPDVLANLAQALLAVGRGNEALATMQQALALAPTDPLVCYRAGVIHEQLGRPDEAKRLYDQALASQPKFAAARQRLEALSRSS
jgi:Flp pilus assembly protein TadD